MTCKSGFYCIFITTSSLSFLSIFLWLCLYLENGNRTINKFGAQEIHIIIVDSFLDIAFYDMICRRWNILCFLFWCQNINCSVAKWKCILRPHWISFLKTKHCFIVEEIFINWREIIIGSKCVSWWFKRRCFFITSSLLFRYYCIK